MSDTSVMFSGTQVVFRDGSVLFGDVDCECCPGSCWYRWSQTYDCDSETWSIVSQQSSAEGVGTGGMDNPFPQAPDAWVKVSGDDTGCTYYYVTQGDPADDGGCTNWPTAPTSQGGAPDDCCTPPSDCGDLPVGHGAQDVGTTGAGYASSSCGGDAVSNYDTITVTYDFNGVGGTVEARAFTGAANPLICRFALECDPDTNVFSIGPNLVSCFYDIFGATDHGAGSGGSCTIVVTGPGTVRVTISGVAGCGCKGTGGPPADSYNIDAAPVNGVYNLTIT